MNYVTFGSPGLAVIWHKRDAPPGNLTLFRDLAR
jgi:hypothetical protein